jgi:short chain dehydrogenase
MNWLFCHRRVVEVVMDCGIGLCNAPERFAEAACFMLAAFFSSQARGREQRRKFRRPAFFIPMALAQFSRPGPKLVGTPATANAQQGWRVSLSSDGNTAIVGGYFDNGKGQRGSTRAAAKPGHSRPSWSARRRLQTPSRASLSRCPPTHQALPAIAARGTECTTSMEGKTCVITGATSGIGRAAAQALAAMGARILMIARNNQRAEAMLAELRDRFAGADHSVHYAGLLQLAEVKRVATDANMLELRGTIFTGSRQRPEGHIRSE